MYGGGNKDIKTFLSSALSKQLLSLMSLEYTLEINKRACSPKCFTKYTSDFFTELRIKYNKHDLIDGAKKITNGIIKKMPDKYYSKPELVLAIGNYKKIRRADIAKFDNKLFLDSNLINYDITKLGREIIKKAFISSGNICDGMKYMEKFLRRFDIPTIESYGKMDIYLNKNFFITYECFKDGYSQYCAFKETAFKKTKTKKEARRRTLNTIENYMSRLVKDLYISAICKKYNGIILSMDAFMCMITNRVFGIKTILVDPYYMDKFYLFE